MKEFNRLARLYTQAARLNPKNGIPGWAALMAAAKLGWFGGVR